jgi:hypothetical protein
MHIEEEYLCFLTNFCEICLCDMKLKILHFTCTPPSFMKNCSFCGLLFHMVPSIQNQVVSFYSYCVSGHYPSSRFYLKHTAFRRLSSSSVFRLNLLSWVQSIELVSITGHQHLVLVLVFGDKD